MKRIYLLIISLFIIAQVGNAQTVPQGMKYQAVARDLNGKIMADQTLFVKITLYNDPVRRDISYVELHKINTGALGVFDLTIGGGQSLTGAFEKVPWSSEEIWIEVAIQTQDAQDYITISNSRMLSVPYAFHAATASEVTGMNRNGNTAGIPSQTWSLFGNSNSDPSKDKLGTTDNVDLVLVTNNIERMRIFANGNIKIAKSLQIGEDLTVDKNVYLNVLSGETINYGDFTVQNQSSTLLSGTLTVDLATDLNSSLNVDGVTNLNSSLSVNNMSPTTLTGTLRVEKDATFKEHVVLDNAAHNSTLPTNGALVVNGGVGIGKNLNVGGDSKFGGAVEFAGQVSITDLTESTSTTTGALKVAGGVGIGKRINVGGDAAMGANLSVTGATTLNSTLGVAGITSLNNTTESSAVGNGALIVAGGTGIAKNLNVGGLATITNGLIVNGSSSSYAGIFNSNSNHGLKIKVNSGTPTNSNHFVTFVNSSGGQVGAIKGESSASDLANNFAYQEELSNLDWEVAFAAVDEATAIADEIQAAVDLVGASTSSTACAGLGVCVTAPIPSLIVAAAAGLIVATANLVSSSIQLGFAIDEKVNFVSDYASHMGVTYSSGSADYAEYLPKLDPNEKFGAGDVIGLKHGFITKNTEGADRIMAISLSPIVLGKVPADGNNENLEMVAFLGQIPVKVMGVVHPGDYILSSGYHNGTAIARNPKNMDISDYNRILGVAWEAATENKLNMVNVAVGLNTNDLTGVIHQQAETIKKQEEALRLLNNQMANTQQVLADLVPGFKAAMGENQVEITTPNRQAEQTPDAHANHDYHVAQVGENDVIYFDITREQLEAGITMAEDISRKGGVDMDTHPFWQKLGSDPAYKQEILRDLENKLKSAYHTHQQLNSSK